MIKMMYTNISKTDPYITQIEIFVSSKVKSYYLNH